MHILKKVNRALISERGAAAVKLLLVASLCLLLCVAVFDATQGRFDPRYGASQTAHR